MLESGLLLCCICLILFVNGKIILNDTTWNEYFKYDAILDRNGNYSLHWNILPNNEHIIEIGLKVKTLGWISFGISPDGNMMNSDIIIAWVDDNTGQGLIQKRYTTSHRQEPPKLVGYINDDIIYTRQTGDTTYIAFTRQLYPCNKGYPQARQFSIGSTNIIYAVSPIDPNFDFNPDGILFSGYYTNGAFKGSQTINFFMDDSDIEINYDNVKTMDFVVGNHTIPNKNGYYCKYLNMTETLQSKHYIVKTSAILNSNHLGTINHINLFHCPESTFNPDLIGIGEECDDIANMATPCGGLNRKIANWAKGSNDFVYPKDVGYPLSGNVYVLLQIYYKNEGRSDSITLDNSGIRIYYTDEERAHDAQWIAIGYPNNGIFIPGGLNNEVILGGYGMEQCGLETIPSTGIRVIGSYLHMHNYATRGRLRHIRGNNEMRPIQINTKFDFNHRQVFNQISRNITVLPGDVLLSQCVYDTSNAIYPIYSGEQSSDEMCLHYILIYPSIDLSEMGTTYDYTSFFNASSNNNWWNGTNDIQINSENQDEYYFDTSINAANLVYRAFINNNTRSGYCTNNNGIRIIENTNYIIPDSRDNFNPWIDPDYTICEPEPSNKFKFTWVEILGISFGISLILFTIIACIKAHYHSKAASSSSNASIDDPLKQSMDFTCYTHPIPNNTNSNIANMEPLTKSADAAIL